LTVLKVSPNEGATATSLIHHLLQSEVDLVCWRSCACQVQMTPSYGDVTGAYRLTQEQFAGAYKAGAGTKKSDDSYALCDNSEIRISRLTWYIN
jgi:hypothetical protein